MAALGFAAVTDINVSLVVQMVVILVTVLTVAMLAGLWPTALLGDTDDLLGAYERAAGLYAQGRSGQALPLIGPSTGGLV